MAAPSGYNTRKRKVDYKKLSRVEGLPSEKRKRNSDELHRIEVMECDQVNGRVKIHYIGYSASEDEW